MKSNGLVTIMAATGVLVLSSSWATAQSSTGGNRGGWFGGGNSSIGLLQNEKIREDLELVDDQVSELEALRDEMYQEVREMWSGMRDLSREERREKWEELRADMEVRRSEFDERISGVLLPHQKKRLDQISMQSSVRRQGGTLGFASSDKLADKLNLTEEQKEELKKAAESAQKELDEKIRKLQEKAKQKVLSVLTEEQREQYKEIMGESFKFEERNRWASRDRGQRRSREAEQESDKR